MPIVLIDRIASRRAPLGRRQSSLPCHVCARRGGYGTVLVWGSVWPIGRRGWAVRRFQRALCPSGPDGLRSHVSKLRSSAEPSVCGRGRKRTGRLSSARRPNAYVYRSRRLPRLRQADHIWVIDLPIAMDGASLCSQSVTVLMFGRSMRLGSLRTVSPSADWQYVLPRIAVASGAFTW